MEWKTGTPDIPKHSQRTYWCRCRSSSGHTYMQSLVYMNAFIMPLSDSVYAPPPAATAVSEDSDEYYWTGWFSHACEHCDTQWTFHDEVLEWMELPLK